MLIYLLLFFLCAFPLLLGENAFGSDLLRKKYAFFIIFLISCVAGLRDMIGGYDVYIYGEFFDGLSLKDFEDGSYVMNLLFEKGYTLYCYFIHLFTDNRYVFFFITSIISYLLVSKSMKLCEEIILFSLFIFFCKYFLMSFVYVRQFLAMGIVWLAVPFIINRNFFKFSIVVLLASTLHTSAVIFFPTYFICKYQYSRNILVWGIVVSILLGLTSVIKYLFSFVGGESGLEKVIAYGTSEAGAVNYFYLLESLLLSIGIIKCRDELYSSENGVCLTNIAYCYVCFSFLTMRDATILRLIWYFLIGFIYVIPNICSYAGRYIHIIKPMVILYFTLLFFRLLLIWDGGDMMPYKTFLDNNSRNGRWEYLEYDMNYKTDRFYK